MRWPGLIDPHVHMREPGGTHKEDWSSGTAAALAGGFTQVLAMPNTDPPVVDNRSLTMVHGLAEKKAHCDFAQYLGATPDNAKTACKLAHKSAGLKLYLDQTYGPLRLDSMALWQSHLQAWPADFPVVAHAEGRTMAAVILLAALSQRPLHLAHVATREEILLVKAAKERGINITCEVTPHHLFLTIDDLADGWREVRPRLGTGSDVAALWENLPVIDCFATDHAPHTAAEKVGENTPPGFPGLETALPLLLTAVHEGRMFLEDVSNRLGKNVRQIFRIPTQQDTWIEVDLEAKRTLSARHMHSKAMWTPFEGWPVRGAVQTVTLRGKKVYQDGRVLSPPGFGKGIR